MQISASLLNVNEDDTETLYKIESAKTDYFHIDVMDGKFVENNTDSKMKKMSSMISNILLTPMEVHLMVEDIKKYVDEYEVYRPNTIIFHIEVAKDSSKVMENINYIKDLGIKVGISINPETDVKEILPYLQYIHEVLVMSVHPGKGGQEFIKDSLAKIKQAKEYILENNLETEINVDGGVNKDNISEISNAGADIATVGSALINSIDYNYMINLLKKA